jgi:hypothetical protein
VTLWHALSLALAVVTLLPTAYLGGLALLSARGRPPASGDRRRRFAAVVPSHNEEANIGATVQSLLATDWPEELRQVVVVADNCSDATAERAEEAGARVLVRVNEELRGKGYALELAFETLLEESEVDAIVVVDADTLVTPNLLAAYDARLEAGEHAVQAEYGVRNVHASWRTRLMTVALAMFHGVRSYGRERLGLSVGLRGNGMCFSTDLLRAHPHEAYGLVEDVEYGIAIGLGGHRVAYAGEAEVLGEMVSGGQGAATQRQRWEGGRRKLAREQVPRLVAQAVGRRSAMLFDLAMDLLVPPLSYVGLLVGTGVAIELVLLWVFGAPGVSTWVWLACVAGLALYVVRGVQLSGLGLQGWLALAWAPVYVFWKVVSVRPWKKSDDWVRTEREAERSADGEGE